YQLKRHTGVEISAEQWQQVVLEDIYRLNIRLIDEGGEVLTMGRDLAALKAKYRGRVSNTIQQSPDKSIERQGLAGWDFEELPEVYDIRQQGLTIRTYPALVFNGSDVDLKLLDNPSTAANKTRQGLLKLYQSSYPQGVKYLRKDLLKGQDLKLKAAGLPSRDAMVADLIDAAYLQAMSADRDIPRNREAFAELLAEGKGNIVSEANALEQLLVAWLPVLVEIQRTLKKQGLAAVQASADIKRQLAFLFQDGFFTRVPREWLQQYQRYLNALLMRLEKLPGQPQKDRDYVRQLENFEDKLSGLEEHWEDYPPALQEEIWQFRFMLQEYRVSLFAQQLRTLFPVSDKRILAKWQELESALVSR
ncbi:MAG: DUF3418 domain-containing protein, partial [Gammaproteobacteria bacterium]